ncbi:MAG TPA: complex I subunit 1 family protein, partial [bacterium]|nr:complex I subunit 1 family protein [bacterium]
MGDFAHYLVGNGGFFASIGEDWTNFILMLTAGAVLLGVFMTIGGLMTYAERKVAAFTQSRIGPNRVGPWGLGQFLADGIKLILKEDIIPVGADRPLFKLAPYAVVGGAFIVMAVLPLGPNLVPVDSDFGLLVYLAAGSFVTMGIVMSGWASNNKWSTMGAARSVAQIVSYEIPVGMSLLPAILLTGSISFQSFVTAQGAYPWQWNIFHSPGMFVCAFCYLIAAMAEINRTPFDIPEAESELVSGYNTEYSGMRFALFFLAEFANNFFSAGLAVTLFLGGWHG